VNNAARRPSKGIEEMTLITKAEAVNRFGDLTRSLHTSAVDLVEVAFVAPVLMQATPLNNLEALNIQLSEALVVIDREIERREVESVMDPEWNHIDLTGTFDEQPTAERLASVLNG
jgi:hypothetical protein